MKIRITLPSGSIEIERQPLSREKFDQICCVLYAAIAATVILGFIALVAR